jgi:hypothetical protein
MKRKVKEPSTSWFEYLKTVNVGNVDRFLVRLHSDP